MASVATFAVAITPDPRTVIRARGFTLAEIAIVLLIIALLSAGALSAFRLQNLRAQFAETRAQLEEARQSLLSFAVVSGALPCPDTDDDGGSDACQAGGVSRGTLPWRDLALPQRDPWGQVIRYAVHREFADISRLSLASVSDITVARKNASGPDTALASPEAVAAALWSSGEDTVDASIGLTSVIAESPASDDIVVWVSRFVLIGRLLEAGRDVPHSSP